VVDSDSIFSFSDIELTGNFYNGLAGGPSSASTAANWWELGKVSNVAQPVINNGVIVSLAGGSRRTVTGTSYLSALSLDAASSVDAPGRKRVSMTVDGTATEIKPGGSYTGAIVVTLA
jgi:hypothetical protein